MTAFLIALGLLSTVATIAFLVTGIKWALRQVSADDCCSLDLDDCI